MSNASLKEQLQAVASKLSDTVGTVNPIVTNTAVSNATVSNSNKVVHSNSNDRNHDRNHDRRPKKPYRPSEKSSKPAAAPTKPKPKWLDYVQYGVELLKVYFPTAFKSANDVKPLKKGIKQDLVRRLSTIDTIVTDDKACMVKSLAFYVNTASYHRSVVEGATRIDLDGNSAGVVSAEEAKYSVDRHQAKLQAKQDAKSTPAAATENKEGKEAVTP